MQRAPGSASGWKRFGWLLLIWCASVAALGVVAWVIRLGMHAAGMRSG
jgi:Protein of unknown function (DUF2474)